MLIATTYICSAELINSHGGPILVASLGARIRVCNLCMLTCITICWSSPTSRSLHRATARDVITHRISNQCKMSCKIHFCMASKTHIQMCAILEPSIQLFYIFCTNGCLFIWLILSLCRFVKKRTDGPTKRAIEFECAMQKWSINDVITVALSIGSYQRGMCDHSLVNETPAFHSEGYIYIYIYIFGLW